MPLALPAAVDAAMTMATEKMRSARQTFTYVASSQRYGQSPSGGRFKKVFTRLSIPHRRADLALGDATLFRQRPLAHPPRFDEAEEVSADFSSSL